MAGINRLVKEFGECCERRADSLPHWDQNLNADFQSVMREDEQGILAMQIGHIVLPKGASFAGQTLSVPRTLVVSDPVLFCPFCGTHLQEEANNG